MAELKRSFSVTIDYRWVIALLAAVIVIMLAVWQPWQPRYDRDARTVSATGDATIKAVPDEYAFYPVYTLKNSDKATAIAESSKKSDEVVQKLKELGVADSKIKTSVNGYQDMYMANQSSGDYVYTVSLTVTLSDKTLAQKVQDYLVSTGPEGGVSPQPTFSESKRKQLESVARGDASKDARKKAEQLANTLGGRIGDIKTITDSGGFGGVPIPMMDSSVKSVAPSGGPTLTLQPGENELTYSVSVEYYLR